MKQSWGWNLGMMVLLLSLYVATASVAVTRQAQAQIEGEAPDEFLQKLLAERTELLEQLKEHRHDYQILTLEPDADEDDLAELDHHIKALEYEIRFFNRAVEGQRELVKFLVAAQEAKHLNDPSQRDSAFEAYEALLESVERRRWLAELQLDLALQSLERLELQENGHGPRLDQIERLTQQQIGVLEELTALEPGQEPDNEDLEGRLEELDEQRSLNRELLDRVIELGEAREDGDLDQVEFLERVVRNLGIELGELDEEASVVDSSQSKQNPAALPVTLTSDDLQQAEAETFAEHARPILEMSCVDCHGSIMTEGDLNIETMLDELPLARNRDAWRNVMEQVRTRSMPPFEAVDLEESERRTLLAHLHQQIEAFDYESVRDPGSVAARRLTHEEYNRTVRDLFGIDRLYPSTRFPDDLSGESGFTNTAETLFLQPLLVEGYLAAAEDVVAQSLPLEPTTEAQRRAIKRVFVAEPDDLTDETEAAQTVLNHFLLKAWRRPPSPAESRWALDLFNELRPDSESFRGAILDVLPAILVSPKFLMHLEPASKSNEVVPVDNYALASRLSYFLWSTMPDDRLFQKAAAATLNDPTTLLEEVRRMLKDPKSETLGTVLAGQWLGFDQLGVANRPDPIDNPWCTDTLIESLKQETALFVHSLIREDQPITRLLDADYTYLNEELAEFYGVEGVQGAAMRRVAIDPAIRGGVLGQASILALTSFPGRTSPVVRGHWILSTLLGTPPPPPPPNVSQLSEEVEENDHLTFREKLQLHSRNPNCNACHSQMDPLGFSLQGYDWFGRWRPDRGRIDDRGQLPDGTSFQGPEGLKAILVDQRSDDLVRQVSIKTLTYALGRQLDYRDEATVRDIVAHVQRHQNRFQSLIEAVVLSEPFRFRKQSDPDQVTSITGEHAR